MIVRFYQDIFCVTKILCKPWKRVILLLSVLFSTVFVEAQQLKYTESDRIRMRKEAKNCVDNYIFGLNQLGKADELTKKFREDDIANILNNFFENADVRIYDDLSRSNQNHASFTAKDYLDKIGAWYRNGVMFEYNYEIKNPCFHLKETENERNYYYVKVDCSKRLNGDLFLDESSNINTDSVDIYVKFQVLQNRPSLITGPARIYTIEKHQQTFCEEELINNLPPLSVFEEESLRKRAEWFVYDFALTLNIIGNPNINERHNTTDYFENNNVEVYNDILPITLLEKFSAEDYLNNIELWFQQGIEFIYHSVKATNVLIEQEYVSVEVEVDRSIRVPDKAFKDRQKISIFVKFPVDPDGRVGAERSTPRIYKTSPIRVKTNPRNYIAIGMQLNTLNYFGDLNPLNRTFSTEIAFTRPSIGFHFTKKITPNFFVRAALSFGRLLGSDFRSADFNNATSRFRYIRNLHFRNNIQELSLVGMYDVIPNDGLYYRRRLLRPYIFGGIAVFTHNPQAKTPVSLGLDAWVDLQPLGTEGQGNPGYAKKYSRIQLGIPMGIGVKFRLNRRIDLAWEMGFRYTFTDYLDDVSRDYPDIGDLDTPTARALSNRSLEMTDALTGKTREAELNRFLIENDAFLSFIGSDGSTYQTVNGFGRRGDQRGSTKSNDFYIMTGFHITYFIGVGRKRGIKQSGRFDINVDYDSSKRKR